MSNARVVICTKPVNTSWARFHKHLPAKISSSWTTRRRQQVTADVTAKSICDYLCVLCYMLTKNFIVATWRTWFLVTIDYDFGKKFRLNEVYVWCWAGHVCYQQAILWKLLRFVTVLAPVDDLEKQNRTTAWPMIIKLRGGRVSWCPWIIYGVIELKVACIFVVFPHHKSRMWAMPFCFADITPWWMTRCRKGE